MFEFNAGASSSTEARRSPLAVVDRKVQHLLRVQVGDFYIEYFLSLFPLKSDTIYPYGLRGGHGGLEGLT